MNWYMYYKVIYKTKSIRRKLIRRLQDTNDIKRITRDAVKEMKCLTKYPES